MTKTLDKKEKLRVKSNSESMSDVVKIWKEISEMQEAQKVEFNDYPYGLTLAFYNKHQSHITSLLKDKLEELDFIEKMIDAQNTKYKMEN